MLTHPRSFPTSCVVIGLAATVASAPLLAQQQGRLSRECRQEIVQMCGTDRSQIRACVSERYAELSEPCVKELRARMGQRDQRKQAEEPQPESEG